MKEISFLDVFAKDTKDNGLPNLYGDHKAIRIKYLLAIYAIEVLKQIQPAHVDECIGYMYAVNHGETMHPDTTKGWNYYSARRCKDIESETIFNALDMISKLVEPFANKQADTTFAESTIALPQEIARVILNEDLTDPNVMNTLELSVRNLNLTESWERGDIRGTSENIAGYTRIAFGEVVKKFQPLLDKCKFSNSISEERLRKDYNAYKLHEYAIWLSCLYRLFYTFEKDYWDTFDEVFKEHCPYERYAQNPYLKKAFLYPVAVPETVIGAVSDKKYQEPPFIKNRSSYISLSERYLSLLYWQLESK